MHNLASVLAVRGGKKTRGSFKFNTFFVLPLVHQQLLKLWKSQKKILAAALLYAPAPQACIHLTVNKLLLSLACN